MKHRIVPNLWFDTQAEEAAAFYVSVFGGEESRCGWLKDRYGLSWQVVPTGWEELLNDPEPERGRRAMEAMFAMRKLGIAALRAAADGDVSA